MAADKLNQAAQFIKAGNKQAALPILKQIVQSEPNNESAWLWLYSCVDDISQKKYCLQKVLSINPSNMKAREALEKLSFADFPTPQSKPKLPQQEVIYYQQGPVTVTSSRVVFGGETHVMRNITSVRAIKLPPKKTTGYIVIAFSILLCACMAAVDTNSDSYLVMILGLLSVPIAIAGIIIAITAKPPYAVEIVSGSGVINGYISKEKQEVNNIVSAINDAIVARN